MCLFVPYVFYLLRGTQQSAGGIDVLSAAGTDGGKHAVTGKIVSERLHARVVDSPQVDLGYLVEADKVDAAVEPLEQRDNLLGMLDAVVDSVENDILEREAALMGEVVVAQQLNDLFDAHTATWQSLSSIKRFSLLRTPTDDTVMRLGLQA